MNACGDSAASRESKRATIVRATPSSANDSSLLRNEDRRGGADPGAKNSRGWGSNVNTADGSARSSAASMSRDNIA